MKRVYVISRLRAGEGRTMAQNIDLAERLARGAVLAGVSPLPPHALYTRFLNDNDPGERFLGMKAGAAWLPVAEEAWVFTRYGISSGMAEEINIAHNCGVPVIEDPPCWAEIDRPLGLVGRCSMCGGPSRYEPPLHRGEILMCGKCAEPFRQTVAP